MVAAGVLHREGRFELIGGEIFDLPAENGADAQLKATLSRFFAEALPSSITVATQGVLRFSEHSWPSPEIALLPASAEAGMVRGGDVLLVIELAASSLGFDLNRKAQLYRAEGVREYWVIDVNARQVHVHRADGDWPGFALPYTSTLEPSLIPGLKVRLADLLPG
jgi:Uma2 family endonuclease